MVCNIEVAEAATKVRLLFLAWALDGSFKKFDLILKLFVQKYLKFWYQLKVECKPIPTVYDLYQK